MSNEQPVIRKVKKVVHADGHHGGAWKVAYADFVTAMMAFFMLMWLLNATSETQRQGLADYFSPSITVSATSGGGNDMFRGSDVASEETLVMEGQGASSDYATESQKARGSSGVDPAEETADESDPDFETIESQLMGRSGESFISDLDRRHVVTRLTDEGLVVELFDLPGDPLVENGEATPVLERLVAFVSEAFAVVPNDIEVRGYVASRAVVALGPPVWTQTADRAELARTLMLEAGTDGRRIRRLTGLGDQSPAVLDPMAPRNNRIELVLLRDPV